MLRKQNIAFAALAGTLVAGGLATFAWTASQADESPQAPHSDESAAPPPALTYQFLDASGTFVVPTWDDRALTPEQKEADPSLNPAWVPFGQCLRDAGLEVREDESVPFAQRDLDRLLERVNSEHPDKSANRAITRDGLDAAEGSARVYLACATEWLEKTPRDIFELTGVPNDWYPPRTAP